MLLLLVLVLTFGVVFFGLVICLCKVSAQGEQAATEANPYHEQLTAKYACTSTPAELAELAAQRWAGDRSY